MEVAPVLQKLWSLSKDLGDGALIGKYFVYRVQGTKAFVRLTFNGSFSLFVEETKEELAKEALGELSMPWVLCCCQMEFDRVSPPSADYLPNDAGRRWWNLILGSGPVRKMGYSVSAMVSARDETEASAHVARIQQTFNDDRPLTHGSANIILPDQWIEFPNEYEIRKKEPIPQVVERLRDWLVTVAAQGCTVYQVRQQIEKIDLALWASYAPFARSIANYDEAAVGYFRRATTRTCILNKDRVNSPPSHWHLDKHGRQIFGIVIGSGAVRAAGYAIGALLPAVDKAEALRLMSEIQQLFI